VVLNVVDEIEMAVQSRTEQVILFTQDKAFLREVRTDRRVAPRSSSATLWRFWTPTLLPGKRKVLFSAGPGVPRSTPASAATPGDESAQLPAAG
jgi:hypothetical protein